MRKKYWLILIEVSHTPPILGGRRIDTTLNLLIHCLSVRCIFNYWVILIDQQQGFSIIVVYWLIVNVNIQLLSHIDWPLRRSILYWIYWLISEVYYQLLSILIDQQQYTFLPLKWISSQRKHFVKRNMFTHIFLSPKCIKGWRTNTKTKKSQKFRLWVNMVNEELILKVNVMFVFKHFGEPKVWDCGWRNQKCSFW